MPKDIFNHNVFTDDIIVTKELIPAIILEIEDNTINVKTINNRKEKLNSMSFILVHPSSIPCSVLIKLRSIKESND